MSLSESLGSVEGFSCGTVCCSSLDMSITSHNLNCSTRYSTSQGGIRRDYSKCSGRKMKRFAESGVDLGMMARLLPGC